MKLYKRKIKYRKIKFPGENGQMIISIDDGYVEWQYMIKTNGDLSINNVIDHILKKFNARILKSDIRTEFKTSVKQD